MNAADADRDPAKAESQSEASAIAVTIHYLQMTEPPAAGTGPLPRDLTIERLAPSDGRVNRRFYEDVGRDWRWTDRLTWSTDQWRGYAEREALSTWIARLGGDEIGYAELEAEAAGSVQLCYFGLLPQCVGRGLGGPLLQRVIEIAWAMPGTQRLWLHTCTNDHPHALTNYQSRGFTIYDTQTK